MENKKLGELLLRAGCLTREELKKGFTLQKESGKPLSFVLLENGLITQETLNRVLKEQLGVSYVDLANTALDERISRFIPADVAKRYQIVPVQLEKEVLYVAMSDPLDFYAREAARKASKKQVVPMLAEPDGIQYALNLLYGNVRASKALQDMQSEQGEEETTADTAAVIFQTEDVGEDLGSAPTIRLVNSIIERAISERASDIHFEPLEKEMLVRMRIDGVLHNVIHIPKDLERSVVSRVKVMSNMDIAERRVPQDGRFNIRFGEREFDVRVSTIPTIYGEAVTGRLLDKNSGNITKNYIGMQPEDMKKYEWMIRRPNGVVLIVGPTGSGKSTTMYTIINELNEEAVHVITLEDPVEYNISGVNQVQINEATNMTFASGLRSVLRHDPDIIGIGEIRDGETADIAMRSAITGHVVLSTLHANDALGAVDRLIDLGVEPYLVASAMQGVISQRLVRKVCPYCKETYEASKEEKETLGVPTDQPLTLTRGKGCSHCFHTGYLGRTGVFEMLCITNEMKHKISKHADREVLEQMVAHDPKHYVRFRDNAIKLVLNGTTSLQEAMRVMGLEK